MKTFMRRFIAVFVFISLFAQLRYTAERSLGYAIFLLFVSFMIARAIWKGNPKKSCRFGAKPIQLQYSGEQFKIPSSRRDRDSLAIGLTLDLKRAAGKANESRSVSEFVKLYDEMLDKAERLSKLDGKVKSVTGNLKVEFWKLESEFQQHLCDSINRSGDEIIKLSKGELKHERELIKQKILEYKRDLDSAQDRADSKTKEKARIKYRYVCYECNMPFLAESSSLSDTNECEFLVAPIPLEKELERIDLMEGHDFEHWCADLLRKSGFENVNVTQGSGDQGVDIIAEKDGIKYAVQCKCYSSDLGNTPIQEVNTGKTIYHCHIGVVMTNRHFTSGAKQAAEATGTLLWDREAIIKMVEEVYGKNGEA